AKVVIGVGGRDAVGVGGVKRAVFEVIDGDLLGAAGVADRGAEAQVAVGERASGHGVCGGDHLGKGIKRVGRVVAVGVQCIDPVALIIVAEDGRLLDGCTPGVGDVGDRAAVAIPVTGHNVV